MAQEATLDTRAAKTGLAGPAAVAAWADGRRGRLAAAVRDTDLAAMAAAPVVAASPERIEMALAAGLADVQVAYSTWQLGNLADAIDRHLGDAGALGVPAAERPAALERLARSVVDPASGFGVVQLTGHEPVEVPAALCRADGRPVWRPHEERHFATAEHLGTEAGVVTFAARGGARTVQLEVVEHVIERAGLSPDQERAVRGILESDRHGNVLVGPAGTGKSRTVGTVAQAWGEAVGGTVYGVATSQIATSNLAGAGITTLNSWWFVDAVTPDPVTGRARRPLTADDLIVLDEASMSASPDIAAISTAAARAGAKVLYVGDPAQLDAVGAGGLFAHLTEVLPEVHELEQAHRFNHAWEADASLRLRRGDVTAVQEYVDNGRVLTGTLEQMTAAARHSWLSDRLEGLDSVLVVGSNERAADMSGELRAELVALGRVSEETLAELWDGNEVGVGDIVEARRNAWQLRVDPSPEGHHAEAVMNRGRYEIVGRGDDGTVLGRDRHGAIAHFPVDYLRTKAALGYAVTEYGAEGVTADTSNALVDRDATREAVYVDVTRGRAANRLFLVTDREPDAHEPQRVAQVAAERLAEIVAAPSAQKAATAVRDEAELAEASGAALLTKLDVALDRDGHTRHLAVLQDRLGDRAPQRGDPTTERLLAALSAAELAGHDADLLLTRAIESRGLDDVDSVAETLRHRVRGLEASSEPQREVDPADWATRIAPSEGEVPEYAREIAARLTEQQRQLGERVAAEVPAWAQALAAAPDPELQPVERAAWRDRAGAAALYRERAGIDPEQLSLGAPPARDRPLDRALYDAALDATRDAAEPDPVGRDWRAAADAELYQARERWARELEQAPAWVAEELADTHTLARGYREDAVIERARAEQLDAADPARAQIVEDADRSAGFAAQYEAEAAQLQVAHERRAAWWESSAPQRDADAAALDELERRGLPPERVVESEPVELGDSADERGHSADLDSAEITPEVGEVSPVMSEFEVVVEPSEPQPEVSADIADSAGVLEPEPEPEVDAAAELAQARAAARQAELDAIERDAAAELAPQPEPEPEVDLEPEPDNTLAPQLEPSQTELEPELDDDLEMGW